MEHFGNQHMVYKAIRKWKMELMAPFKRCLINIGQYLMVGEFVLVIIKCPKPSKR
jgi:hypothetical protein